MITGDLYNRIFAVQTSNSEVLVDYAVWNQIFAGLPEDYLLPDMNVYTFLPQK
ncbi:hypothetical protein D3C76_1798320 [compost metagenome]